MSAASSQGGEQERPDPVPLAAVGSAPPPAPRDGTDVDHAIALLRGRIDEEFRISERLAGKARQLFALAVGVFAAVQAVVFSSLVGTVSHPGRVVLLGFALVAAVPLLLVGHRLANAEETLEEEDIEPEKVVTWIEENPGEQEVLLLMLGELAAVARSRAANNATRERALASLQNIARWSLIASIVELFVGIVVRL